jgi:uncharacterized protein (TIGR02246 family)
MDNHPIEVLYSRLLDAWNKQDAKAFASLFERSAIVIGFDGSQMRGPDEIEAELSGIFSDHKTARYVAKIRSIQSLGDEVSLLNAVAGMVPPRKNSINPATNAIQSLLAIRKNGDWKISLFQNTAAQFHGRPELVENLTSELQELI